MSSATSGALSVCQMLPHGVERQIKHPWKRMLEEFKQVMKLKVG